MTSMFRLPFTTSRAILVLQLMRVMIVLEVEWNDMTDKEFYFFVLFFLPTNSHTSKRKTCQTMNEG